MGELGIPNGESQPEPVTPPIDIEFERLRAARHLTCGITADWRAYCWGSNVHGQLGVEDTGETCTWTVDAFECSTTPVRVGGDLLFSDLATGSESVCGITLDGHLYCWGSNQWGVLGQGRLEGSVTPVAVVDPF